MKYVIISTYGFSLADHFCHTLYISLGIAGIGYTIYNYTYLYTVYTIHRLAPVSDSTPALDQISIVVYSLDMKCVSKQFISPVAEIIIEN